MTLPPIDLRLVVDVVLVAIVLETIFLAIWSRRSNRPVKAADLLLTLAAGACLVLALRVAVSGGWPGWAIIFLIGSLVAHLLDLRRRWRTA